MEKFPIRSQRLRQVVRTMNRKHFYLSMAVTNIKKNGKFYFPYLLTFAATVAMFYMIHAISVSKHIPGGSSMLQLLSFGTGVITVFAVIFLFYTNSFLIKRRKKEFGLYHILGMEKKHIARVLFCESILVCGVGIVAGLLLGILFHKLLFMLLCRIARLQFSIPFTVEAESMKESLFLFGGIFLITFFSNLVQLAKTKTIELLQGEQLGEREPKTKWIMAVLGIATVGVGYGIALTVENPLDALTDFFIAVILVIIGTYFLFIAGSIVVLKTLRANRKFYYKTSHFTAVSGMLYRMKQNAAGLASICILSSMVLVTVSTTVCLYVGVEDALHTRYPHDFEVSRQDVDASWDSSKLEKKLLKIVENYCEIKNSVGYKSLMFAAGYKNQDFDFSGTNVLNGSQHAIVIITAEEYEKLTGETIELTGKEVAICDPQTELPDTFHLFFQEFQVKKRLKEFANEDLYAELIAQMHYIVVSDSAVLEQITREEQQAYGDMAATCNYYLDIDVKGSKEQQLKLATALSKTVGEMGYVESRAENYDNFYAMYGGFLFLGLFLGVIFVMATTLIIYYKQISEGYDDKQRFEIMQKVGMSKKEVRSSIRSQVLLVFFLPLLTAAVHVCVAFPMIKKMLQVLNMSNADPFLPCLLGTVVVFALLYAVVYSLTSRVYYRIVE